METYREPLRTLPLAVLTGIRGLQNNWLTFLQVLGLDHRLVRGIVLAYSCGFDLRV